MTTFVKLVKVGEKRQTIVKIGQNVYISNSQNLHTNLVQSAKSGIGPFASRVFNLTQSTDKKKLKLVMGQVQIYNRHIKKFSDTAQYFHSKNLKMLHKRHEKHFFPRRGVLELGRKVEVLEVLRSFGDIFSQKLRLRRRKKHVKMASIRNFCD